ncbi:hypothetical protein E0J18_12700 [Rhizobium leguminosarum bv. viciae]|nr:hypothetical protein E0J18_12700 [Rhizobium leguminosarum bv. viciae]
MSMRRNAILPNLDLNRLPNVYKAVVSYVRMTGINPDLVYGLNIGDTQVVPRKLQASPHPFEQTGEVQQALAEELGEERPALHDYVEHHRPEIVKRLEAKGRKVPEQLFLTHYGKPITIVGLQKALLGAITRDRLPEIISPIGEARCVLSVTSGGDSATCYPCPSPFVDKRYKIRTPAKYERHNMLEAFLKDFEASQRRSDAQSLTRRNTGD